MPSLASIALFLSTLFITVPSASAEDASLTIGKLAPRFELKDLAGESVALSSFQGKVVLLNLWSTLCEPCTTEMPSLNRLYSDLKNNGFIVLAVSIDSSDNLVKEFVRDKNISFTILRDKEKEVFFDLFGGPSLPASYLLDRKGIIVETFSGPKKWDSPDMERRILTVLKQN